MTFLCCRAVRHLERVGEILRHPLQVAGDPDFLALRSVGGELGHFADRPHLVLDLVHMVPQLPVAVPLAVDGDQQGDRIPEVGIDHRPLDAVRQLRGADHVQLVAQLRPEEVRVLDVVLEFDVDDHQAGPAGRIGLFLAHLLELEDVLFQGLGDLFLHLLGSRARVERGHQAGTDGDGRVLGPGHLHEGVDSDHDDHRRQDQGHRRVAQGKFDRIHGTFLSRTAFIGAPPARSLKRPGRLRASPVRQGRSARLRKVRS